MLLVLKIPVVYLCLVVWWAIRAEPRPPEAVERAAALEPAPEPGCGWTRRRLSRRPRIGSRPWPSRAPRAGLARARVVR